MGRKEGQKLDLGLVVLALSHTFVCTVRSSTVIVV